MLEMIKQKLYRNVFLECCLMMAVSVGVCCNAVGVFYSPVANAFGFIRGDLAIYISISSFMIAIFGNVVVRNIKPQNFKKIILGGVLLLCGSSILVCFASKLWHFYLYGFVRGIGIAMFGFVLINSVITNWFYKDYGIIMGIVSAFTGVGSALFSPILSSLMENFGWQAGYVAMGVVSLVCCLPALLDKNFAYKPEDVELKPYGELTDIKTLKLTGGHFSIVNLVLIVVYGSINYYLLQITQYLAPYGETLGYSAVAASLLVSLSMIGNIVAKLVMGALIDKLGCYKATLIASLLTAASLVFLIFNPPLMVLYASTLVYGFYYAVTSVATPSLTRNLFGTKSFSKVFSITYMGSCIVGAISTVGIGYIYDYTGSYKMALILGVVIIAINCGVLGIMRFKNR